MPAEESRHLGAYFLLASKVPLALDQWIAGMSPQVDMRPVCGSTARSSSLRIE